MGFQRACQCYIWAMPTVAPAGFEYREYVLNLNPNRRADNYEQLDRRTDYTFEAITVAEGMIKPVVGAGSQYLSAAKDADGNWLSGGSTYRPRVPANVPVVNFWSVTVTTT